jgi:proline iminopeptidase
VGASRGDLLIGSVVGVFGQAEVRRSGLLPVGGAHRVYWEESGAPNGIAAVYLHGGPGSSLGTGGYRTKFDPSRFRIIGLDQRGCGRSTPLVTAPGYDLGQHTTAELICDIEALREHLGVERWLVSGVSWERRSRSPTPRPIRTGPPGSCSWR